MTNQVINRGGVMNPIWRGLCCRPVTAALTICMSGFLGHENGYTIESDNY